MLKKLLSGSRAKTLYTRAVILLLLTALPVSLLSGSLSVSAFAGEITEDFSDDYSDGSEDGNGDGFSFEFQDQSGGEVYAAPEDEVDGEVYVDSENEIGGEVFTDPGNEGSGELPVDFEEETADEVAYGAADGAVESGDLTSTSEEVTWSSAVDVVDLADYLALLAPGVFHVTNGGFPWDSEKKKRSWTYYNGIMMDAYMMLDAGRYFSNVDNFYDANIDGDGKVNSSQTSDNYYRENELDSIPPTRALFDLLRLSKGGYAIPIPDTQKTRFEKMIAYVYNCLRRHTTVNGTSGNFIHKMNNDSWATYQIALDGLYMAQPFFMELANALEDGTLQNYPYGFGSYTGNINPDDIYSAVVNRMEWIAENLYDEDTHLYNHGWGPRVGVNGQYWLRAVGWYAAALADVISMLPDDRYSLEKEKLIGYEKRLFDGMMDYQDPATGMWYNVINYGPELTSGYGNRLESSGSALMAYAMMKSYVEGYVGDEYGEAGLRAFNGTVRNCLIVGDDETYTLQNVYISSGVETTPEGYLKKEYVDNEAKGVGPLIMASTWADEAARIHNNPTTYEISGNGDITLPLNEVPDFSGIELKLTFDNGTERIIPSEMLTFDNYDPAEPGLQEAGIFYNGVQYGTVNVIFEAPEFTAHSLVLSGQIGVNFYVDLNGDISSFTDSYMKFTCNGVESEPVSINPDFMNSSGESYGFTCYVNSLQMAEEITAVFYYGEDLSKTVEDKYSVVEYLEYIIKNQNDFVDNYELYDLARSIYDYGYYAQQYLSRVHGFDLGEDGDYSELSDRDLYNHYNESDFTKAAQDLEEYACSFEESEDGAELPLSRLSYSLILDAETEVRIYLRLQNVNDSVSYQIVEDGQDGRIGRILEEGTSDPQPDGRHTISIKNISAHILGDKYRVWIKIHGDGGDIERILSISALSYASAILNNDEQAYDAKAAMCALYDYYKLAHIYKYGI